VSGSLVPALVELRRDEVLTSLRSRLERGEAATVLLEECRRGMTLVGDRFQKGDYFLAELLLSAELFKSATAVLNPYLADHGPVESHGRVLLAALRGDIHDLGKNILSTLLQAHGFEVFDLGVDVAPDTVLEKARELRPHFVGFSVLITTAFPAMHEAASLLSRAGLRNRLKLMIGGGVTTPTTRDYVGADFQTTDAMEGVLYCMNRKEGRDPCSAGT